ncbi:MAG: malate:Na+ symporter [Sphingomonadales bacterium]|jgi:Na+/citrate or Na+/malate symporter|nr:malate:Na+ symporter [Sphingomonadales bacterium]
MSDSRTDASPAGAPAPADPAAAAPARASWRAMEWSIGIVPVPLFIVILVIVALYVRKGEVPADLTTNILILAAGGFACAQVGKWLPGLRRVGAPAILATFVPSYLVYAHIIPAPLKKSITDFTEQSNFLYLFIGSIIVGSILGMDRRMLIGGFLKIFVPLLTGSLLGALAGLGVATLLGLEWHHALFKIIVPIMGGGVGEGAIPLSIGYAALGGGAQGDLLAEILPSVMFGSLTAVLASGGLNMLGKRRPEWTGEGVLQPGEHDVPLDEEPHVPVIPDLATVGAAVILAMTLYTAGALVQKYTSFPGPITMLLLAVLIKLGRFVSPRLEGGAYSNYRFFAVNVTYPLLFAIGVAKTPWEKLMSAFNGPTIATVVTTVLTLMATGFVVARWVRLYPIEAAIVNACHSGQGGTGDVAILGAANRMQLMPFAQVATRIGGAITVTLALAAFAHWGR